MKRLLVTAAVVALALVGSGLLLAQNTPKDPFVGRWRLNRANSKYANVQPPQHDTVVTVEAQGDARKWIFEGIAADGTQITYSFVIDWDGSKSSPIAGTGAPNGEDTVTFSRVDESALTSTGTKAGKVVYTSRIVASENGKVMTITAEGTNAQGMPVSSTTVWEKQ